jgi:hypothetical protein
MDRQRDSSNTSTRFIMEETLRKGSPARELEPTPAYKLGIDRYRGVV